jgi:phage FluMu gp28-like protein
MNRQLPTAPTEPEANYRWATENARSKIARFLVDTLNLRIATGDPNALWEPFQLEYLNLCSQAPTIAMSKSRQIGQSFVLAMEAVGRAYIEPGSLTNFVSINKAEAEEKIRYATQINECVHPAVRRKWSRENRGELETPDRSRILSHACTPPRGKAKAYHRLDEIAHYQRPQEIYNGAVPGMLRGGGIVLCSSPWVRGGFHYQVMEEPNRYPRFVRMWVPWWEVLGFCTDVAGARENAAEMSTNDRVYKYGTERLQLLYESMDPDAFRVECELAYADDNLAWITWEEIVSCTGPQDMDFVVCTGLDEAMRVIPGLLQRRKAGRLFAGYDVARKHDKAVLMLLEAVAGALVCFAIVILDKVPFAQQKAFLTEITPWIHGGAIDATGLGANLAEDMENVAFKWSPITMSAPTKAQLAVDLRQQFQDQTLLIPPDRDLHRDLHSVQRTVTAANNIIFDAARDEELGHADRFWGLALAVNAVIRQWFSTGITQERILRPVETVEATSAVTGEKKKLDVVPRTANDVNAALIAAQQDTGATRDARRDMLEAMYPGLKGLRKRALQPAEPE